MGGINSPDLARGLGRRFHEAAMRHDDRLSVGWDDLGQRERDTYDAAAADVVAPITDKWPRVKGRCPNCGHLTLILGAGGRVTCSAADCDDPGMVDDLLGFAHRRGNEVRIARTPDSAAGGDLAALRGLALFLVSLDEPEGTGARRTVNLADICARARAALAVIPQPPTRVQDMTTEHLDEVLAAPEAATEGHSIRNRLAGDEGLTGDEQLAVSPDAARYAPGGDA